MYKFLIFNTIVLSTDGCANIALWWTTRLSFWHIVGLILRPYIQSVDLKVPTKPTQYLLTKNCILRSTRTTFKGLKHSTDPYQWGPDLGLV